MKQHHLLFYQINDIIDMVSVVTDQTFLLLQNLLDQLLMIAAKSFGIAPVLGSHLLKTDLLLLHLSERLQLLLHVRYVVVRVERLLHGNGLLGQLPDVFAGEGVLDC